MLSGKVWQAPYSLYCSAVLRYSAARRKGDLAIALLYQFLIRSFQGKRKSIP